MFFMVFPAWTQARAPGVVRHSGFGLTLAAKFVGPESRLTYLPYIGGRGDAPGLMHWGCGAWPFDVLGGSLTPAMPWRGA